MKEIMDTSLVEGYIFFFEVLDMVGKECQHPPEFLTLFIGSPRTTLSPPFFIARKGMRGVSPYP